MDNNPRHWPVDEEGRTVPPVNIRLSDEERRILKECSRESLIRRSIPLAVLLGGATHVLVKRGTLSANPRFGPWIKNTTAALVGFFVGRISYWGECRKKVMQLKNSVLAEYVRRGYTNRGKNIPKYDDVERDDLPTLDSPIERSTENFHLTDIGVDKNAVGPGLSQSLKPSIDDSDHLRTQDNASSPPRSFTNYELPLRNRNEYISKQTDPQPLTSTHGTNEAKRGLERNQYGEVIER